MSQPDDTAQQDQTVELAKAALNRMAENDIAANPLNFTVWYSYFLGDKPELNNTLDLLSNHGVSFTDQLNEEIYTKYFAVDRESQEIQDTSLRIQAAVNEIVSSLADAGTDHASYADVLSEFAEKITEADNPDELADHVKGMLAATQSILDKNRRLKEQLGETTLEIRELREHLEEVRREAMTDALTGIANRKFFDLTLRAEANIATEKGTDLCLLMMDIDHFKQFNDSYGHRVGDEVLKIVARTLKDSLKGQDLPSRYGGEEFCAILPETRIKDAVSVATNIRHALASRKLKNKKTGTDYGSVTLSIGVSQFRYGETLGEFVQRADDALYVAKAEGRNRVVTEPDIKNIHKRAG